MGPVSTLSGGGESNWAENIRLWTRLGRGDVESCGRSRCSSLYVTRLIRLLCAEMGAIILYGQSLNNKAG